MTPTEQDKELRRAIVNYRIKCDYYLSDRDEGVISQEEYETAISGELDSVVELITVDRERVALEARISELKMWELPENEIQMVFANPCNICGHDYPKLRKAQQDRLSALKAQQEEV